MLHCGLQCVWVGYCLPTGVVHLPEIAGGVVYGTLHVWTVTPEIRQPHPVTNMYGGWELILWQIVFCTHSGSNLEGSAVM